MPEIPFLPDRETWVNTVRERDNLAAQLAQARAERDAFRLSVYELREQLRHSVSEKALADAQADLAAERAKVARLRTVAIEGLVHHSDNHCDCDWCYAIRKAFGIEIRAALRGDTAPAGGE